MSQTHQAAVVWQDYHSAVRLSLGAQIVIGVLAALMLDGGLMARVVGVAMLCFWLSTAVIIARRPFQPTQVDLAFVKWGFWAVLAAAEYVQFGI